MKRKRGTPRWRVVLLLLAFVTVVATTWLWFVRDQPPLEELREARTYLNLARDTTREVEAAPIFQAAEDSLIVAQGALNAQYRRIALFRDYDDVRRYVVQSRSLCSEGIQVGRQAREEAMERSTRRLLVLRRSLATTRTLLERMTLKDGALARLVSAEARLAVADRRLAESQIAEAEEMLELAEQEIDEAAVKLRKYLAGFLDRRGQWGEWTRETLAWSRTSDKAAILVDKLSHECHVLKRGRVVETYAVDLGGNWMSQKVREGDRATPEGRYRVTELKPSRYYKAAMLDYPNAADRVRFDRAKRDGRLPRSARIGSLIEIHGDGGRGVDWTAGCVSLANPDYDRLLRHLRVGTPVTIVGLWEEPSWLTHLESGSESLSRAIPD